MERRSASKVSRRSLIALAGGAVGGVLVGGLGKPEAARAGDGDALLLGRNNSASTETLVLSSGGSALRGESTNDVALMGVSTRKAGVRGVSEGADGVVGVGSGKGKSGVRGQNPTGRGVLGKSADGTGAAGVSTNGVGLAGTSRRGRGVVARSSQGVALDVEGAVQFKTSGLAVVPEGQLRVRVKAGVPVTTATKVLATVNGPEPARTVSRADRRPAVHLEQPIFIWFVDVDTPGNTFDIVLTDRVEHDVNVAWFVIS